VLLLTPLLAMQFTDEVNWNVFDFVFVAALVTIAAVVVELAVRRAGSLAYKAGAGLAVAGCAMLIVLTGAVGIIGSEDHDANLLYGAVLAVIIGGAIVARFRPRGMMAALIAAAVVQTVIAAVAVIAGWGSDTDPEWPRDVFGATAMFVAIWLASAWLFSRSARTRQSSVSPPDRR
jgi:hypothetical protein